MIIVADYTNSSINSGQLNDMQESVGHAKTNKLLLDNISKIYKFENQLIFPMHFLRKYENIFKTNLLEMDLDKSLYYRPEYISNLIFGTVDLWYLILFVNDMKSPMDLCTKKVLVPSNNYMMEVVNKLKLLEVDVENSHKEPIELERNLLKNINSASDIIVNSSNEYRMKNIDKYEELKPFINPYIHFDFYLPVSSSSTIPEKGDIIGNIPNSYTPYFDYNDKHYAYVSLPTDNKYFNNFNTGEIKNSIFLEKEKNYVLLKRYNGDGSFKLNKTINEEEYKIILNENNNSDRILFDTPIMTYDLREGCILPEFAIFDMVLNIDEELYDVKFSIEEDKWVTIIEENISYQTNVIIDDGEEETNVIITIPKGSYEIKLNNKDNYYYIQPDQKIIITSDNGTILSDTYDLKDFQYFLEYKNNGEKIHSNEIWLANLKDSKISLEKKIEDDKEFYEVINKSNKDLLDNTTEMVFNKRFGGYILQKTINSLPEFKENIIHNEYLFQLMIDLEKDLAINNINIEDYEFLGLDMYYSLIREENCPYSITPLYVVYEVLEDDDIKYYHFKLPYETIDENGVINLYETINNNRKKVSNIKKILPLIYNCENKKRINIKKIYISSKYKYKIGSLTDYENRYENIENYSFTFSIAGIKLYGFKYKEIAKEFNLSNKLKNPVSDIYDLFYEYDYENSFESPYFEPFIFERNTNLIESFNDPDVSEETLDEELNIKKTHYKVFEMNRKLNSKNGKIDDYIKFDFDINDKDFNFDKELANTIFKNSMVESYIYNNINGNKLPFNLDYNYKIEIEIINNCENNDKHSNASAFKFGIGNSNNYLFFLSDRNISIDENNKINYENNSILNNYDDKNFYHILENGLYLETDKGIHSNKIFKDIPNLTINNYNIKTFKDDLFNYIEDNNYKRYKIRLKFIKSNSNFSISYKVAEQSTDNWSDYKLLLQINDPLYPYNDKETFINNSKNTLFKICNYYGNFNSFKLISIELPIE